MKGSMAIDETINENACFYNGSKLMLYDTTITDTSAHITSYYDMFEKYYKNITQKDIHDAIKKYFTKANMTVCILGEQLPELQKIKRICEKVL
jgi:hypothetical protein